MFEPTEKKQCKEDTYAVLSLMTLHYYKVVSGCTRLSPRGSTATMIMLWRNSWSVSTICPWVYAADLLTNYSHVTRSNLSCNLQRDKRCVANCKKKFTCYTPFCNCNCCVASCKKSRTTLYFSQRCETSCLRVTSPQQLATQFCQNGPIRAHLSLAGDFKMASAILFVIVRVASCEKSCKRVTPPLQLERFFIRHRCVASCKKNCFV